MLNKFSLFILVLIFSGCAAGEKVTVNERYFWPSPPDEPKLEWLGAYNSHLDFKGKRANNILTFLTGEEDSDGLQFPTYIASDSTGKVYVSDKGRQAVVVFNFNQKDTHLFAGGEAATGLVQEPLGIDFDSDGNIYIGDLKQPKIVVYSKDEKPIRVIDYSNSIGRVNVFKIDQKRKHIVIPDPKDHKVHITDMDGNIIKTIYTFNNVDGMDGFRAPSAVALEPNGNIVVADTVNARIVRFTPEGEFLSTIGIRGDNLGTIDFVKGVAVDSDSNIYMVDFRGDRLQVYNTEGKILMGIGDKTLGGELIGTFRAPNAVSIDKNDTIYVAETIQHRFQIYQYITKKYLEKNPITDSTAVGKKLSPVTSETNVKKR